MPHNPKLYHPKWTLITRLIRRRAGNRCEKCGAENGAVGYRHTCTGVFHSGEQLMEQYDGGEPDFDLFRKPVKIVLTTAHLDQDRRNNRFANLACLCQICHLAHDRKANVIRRRYGRYYFDTQTLFDG